MPNTPASASQSSTEPEYHNESASEDIRPYEVLTDIINTALAELYPVIEADVEENVPLVYNEDAFGKLLDDWKSVLSVLALPNLRFALTALESGATVDQIKTQPAFAEAVKFVVDGSYWSLRSHLVGGLFRATKTTVDAERAPDKARVN